MTSESGSVLREARRRARLSQSDVARRARCAQSVISAYESGRREPSIPTLARLVAATGHELVLELVPSPGHTLGLPDTPLGRRLRRHRQAIIEIAAARGAHNVRVFGSIGRGEDTATSDIDLLVDLDDGVGLVAVAGLKRELSELLHSPVDVVPAGTLKARIRAEVLAESVTL